MSRTTFLRRLLSACVAVATPSMLATAQSYNWILNQENGHHYAITAPLSWQAAEAAAVAVGGHLATIRSSAENSWILQNFPVPAPGITGRWIGYNDAEIEGVWVWSSGETPGYSNWYLPGEPNNTFGNEDAAEIGVDWASPRWIASDHTSPKPGVIEVSGPPCTILPSAMGCYPGVNGVVHALEHWDPDGPLGPSPLALVIGGFFTLAGSKVANNIAVHDPASGSWSALGTGTNGTVLALTVLSNGDLVAAGDFTTAGDVAANRIARWSVNSRSWFPLGIGTNNGLNNFVLDVATLPNGHLAAGGIFTDVGGVAGRNYLTAWNPATNSWYSIGTPNGSVTTLATLSNGVLVIGGQFSQIAGVNAQKIARRSPIGGLWSAFPGSVDGPVLTLHALPNSAFAMGGSFNVPARGVAIWSGSWSGLGAGITNGTVRAITSFPVGPGGQLGIVVGGTFVSVAGGYIAASGVAYWNGSWSPLGAGVAYTVNALITIPASGEIVAGGPFTKAGVRTAHGIANWNGMDWSSLCQGIDDDVLAFTETPDGSVIAGGSFTASGSDGARFVARWNGLDWTRLGNGPDGTVRALATMPNGDVVAGGDFLHAGGPGGGNNARCIARWNGADWLPLGPPTYPGMNDKVHALVALPNGNLIAGGDFDFAGGFDVNHVARWNGYTWQPMGPGLNGTVYALAVLPNGDVVAGGAFPNFIAIWNDILHSWSSPGGVNDVVYAVASLGDGSFLAGGGFTMPANGVARWHGSWSSLGTGVNNGFAAGHVHALTVLANGDVVAGGSFWHAGVISAYNIARWDVSQSQWTRISGMDWIGTNSDVRALLTRKNGEVVAGGDFLTLEDGLVPPRRMVVSHAMRMITTCPALAVSLGTACPGLYGAVELTPVSMPFVDSTFRARASSYGLNLALTGFSLLSPPRPLSSVLPQGVLGCDVLVAPAFTELVVPDGYVATSRVVIPDNVSLVGAVFYHQMLVLDGTLPVVTDIMSTNALKLTIGSM